MTCKMILFKGREHGVEIVALDIVRTEDYAEFHYRLRFPNEQVAINFLVIMTDPTMQVRLINASVWSLCRGMNGVRIPDPDDEEDQSVYMAFAMNGWCGGPEEVCSVVRRIQMRTVTPAAPPPQRA